MTFRHFLSLALAVSLPAGATRAPAATGDITLVGHLSLVTSTRITNVWGYYDYATGKEYALVGDWNNGLYIVDVTNPAVPIEIRKIIGVPGFDLKPYGHYLYTCDGNSSGIDSRIIDISNPGSPIVLPNKFPSCHTISISTRGVMFTEYAGVRIYDLVNDPTNPDSLYHILNQGHDSTPRGDRLYDFNGGMLNIWNVSDPSAPALIGSDDDPAVLYYHSGDESKNHDYLYVCDEYAVSPTPDIVIYDISNPVTPTRIGSINDETSRVHQLYVVGDLMFVGYYTAGFKVFDVSNPAAPVLADEFDTSAFQTETGSDVYSGAYNAYPFAPSGIVYVADHPNGLYLFSVEGHTGAVTSARESSPGAATLAQNFPNPFNPSTTIPFELHLRQRVVLRVFDVRGQLVRTLVDQTLAPGAHTASWSGADESGQPVASGVYYYQLDAGPTSLTRRMVLLK